MREILFKAKAINRDNGYHRTNYKNGDWVYGLITRLFDDRFENLPAEMMDENGVSGIEIDHNTICQYTGLTDKNGNKIWENDIIRCGRNTVVSWDEHFASWCLTRKGWLFKHFFGESQNPEDCEVIGNIFDNPELLEGGGEDE